MSKYFTSNIFTNAFLLLRVGFFFDKTCQISCLYSWMFRMVHKSQMLQNHKPPRFGPTAGLNIHWRCYHKGTIWLLPYTKISQTLCTASERSVFHTIWALALLLFQLLPCFQQKLFLALVEIKHAAFVLNHGNSLKGFKNNARGWSIHLILIKYFQLVLNKMNQHLEELFTPNLSNMEGRLSWFTRQFFKSSKIAKPWRIISSKRRKCIPPCWISAFAQKNQVCHRKFWS